MLKRRSYPKGDKNKLSKLTSDDVKLIKQRIDAGEKQVDIAKEYSVHPSLINKVYRGHKWN